MDPLTCLIVETHRLQLLAHIRRRRGSAGALPTAWNICSWMGIDIRACAELIDELVEDGFLEPPPPVRNRLTLPLELSPLGEGYVAWVETHPT